MKWLRLLRIKRGRHFHYCTRLPAVGQLIPIATATPYHDLVSSYLPFSRHLSLSKLLGPRSRTRHGNERKCRASAPHGLRSAVKYLVGSRRRVHARSVLATTGVLLADHRIPNPFETAFESITYSDKVLSRVGDEAGLDSHLWLCGPCAHGSPATSLPSTTKANCLRTGPPWRRSTGVCTTTTSSS